MPVVDASKRQEVVERGNELREVIDANFATEEFDKPLDSDLSSQSCLVRDQTRRVCEHGCNRGDFMAKVSQAVHPCRARQASKLEHLALDGPLLGATLETSMVSLSRTPDAGPRRGDFCGSSLDVA